MNAKLKKKWIKALRSGDYKQGYEALRNHKNEHCCLGVLADVAKLGWRRNTSSPSDNYFTKNGSDTSLTSYQCTALKLPFTLQERAINRNDKKKWSFKRIAKWLEGLKF